MLKFVGAGENLSWASYDFEIFADARPDIDNGAEDYQRKVMTVLGEGGWPFRQHITYDETGDRLLPVYEDVAKGAGLTPGWFVDHVETFSQKNLERIAANLAAASRCRTASSSRPRTSSPITVRRR